MSYKYIIFILLLGVAPIYSGQLIDRFGDTISIKNTYTNNKSPICLAQNLNYDTIATKNFTLLILKDNNYKSGFGDNSPFLNSTLGERRKLVLKTVFDDLSVLINSNVKVKIEVSGLNEPNKTILAAASPYYNTINGADGLISGSVLKSFASGADAYVGTEFMDSNHGYLKINFAYDFNLDFDATSFNSYDLYTIILHETMHLLDFCSSINGALKNQYTFTGAGPINYYDNFIYFLSRTGELIKLLQNFPGFQCSVNSAFSIPYLNADCKSGDRLVFITKNDTINLYSPPIYSKGSTSSHLDDICNTKSALMNPKKEKGEYCRFPGVQEYDILNTIGVPLNNEFGLKINPQRYAQYSIKNNVAFAGDDFLQDTLTIGEYYTIKFDDLIKNDFNIDSIVNIDVIDTCDKVEFSATSLSKQFNTLQIRLISKGILYLNLRYKSTNSNFAIIKIAIKYPIFNSCDGLTGNYICNSGIENSIYLGLTYGKQIGDIFIDGYLQTQAWRGYGGGYFTRNKENAIITGNYYKDELLNYFNIPASTKIRTKYDNGTPYSIVFQNPDTWDVDKNNKWYMCFGWGSSFWGTYSGDLVETDRWIATDFCYQQIKLAHKKKYVIELMGYSRYETFWDNDKEDLALQFSPNNKYKDDKILIYIDRENPCIGMDIGYWKRKKHQTNYFGEQILINEHLPINQWTHLKSKPFDIDTIPSDSQYVFIGGDLRSLPDSVNAQFSVLIDDIIIREAGVGITSYVDSYYPCVGSSVNYRFKVWKDIPGDKNDVELINELASGFEYISGDFQKNVNGLYCKIPANKFNDSGIAYVTMKVKVPDDLSSVGKRFVNTIYPKDMPENMRSGLGKYQIIVTPVANSIYVEKSLTNKACSNADIFVKLKIKNMTTNTLTKTKIIEHTFNTSEMPYNSKKYNTPITFRVFLNGVENNDSTGNIAVTTLSNGDISISGFVIPPMAGDGDDGINTLEFVIHAKEGVNILKSQTEILQYEEGCGYISTLNETEILQLKMKPQMPSDTLLCGEYLFKSLCPECKHEWNDGDTSSTRSLYKDGSYWVKITNSDGCSILDTMNLRVVSMARKIEQQKDSFKLKYGDEFVTNQYFTLPEYFINKTFTCYYKIKYNKNMVEKLYQDYRVIYEDDKQKIIEKSFTDKITKDNYLDIINADKWKTITNNSSSAKIYYYDFTMLGCTAPTELSYLTDIIGTELSIGAISPNPANDKISFEYTLPTEKEFQINIFDVLGRKRKQVLSGSQEFGNYKYEMKIDDLPSGSYTIILTQSGIYKSAAFTIVK